MIIFGTIGVVVWQITPIVIEQLKDLVLNEIPKIYDNFNEYIAKLNLDESETLKIFMEQIQAGLQSYLTSAIVLVHLFQYY